jgi:hypothetical protein
MNVVWFDIQNYGSVAHMFLNYYKLSHRFDDNFISDDYDVQKISLNTVKPILNGISRVQNIFR